jgi:naphthoate synthase
MIDDSNIRYETSAGVATITINRPDRGNMMSSQTADGLAEALRSFARDPLLGVAILTGEGDRFFCLGGEHDELTNLNPSSALGVVEVYRLLDTIPKPVIACVNGYAVGGGQVLQLMCDLGIAAESAVFRQVGPMVGSFDAGYGTWYLEATVGRRRAKEIWYLNRKYSAREALDLGLINEVVPDSEVRGRARELADELLSRGPGALAALKAAFSGRHHGVLGQAYISHDQLLTRYLPSEEAKELSDAFRNKREPDRARFGN